MHIEQIYTGCLAHGAYYIESQGEVAIIDPLREAQPYLERAEKKGHQIKYIFETHFHADFVSGHLDLAKKTGASIVYGPGAKAAYDIYVAKDEETFSLGEVTIKVLHTPGHTLESSCFLLIDAQGNPHSLFSGDTLFIGDVGRPDLAVKSDLSKEDLASLLYDSLRNKIMPLADEVVVYPGHGAGSACGKNLSKETSDKLGNQKKTNYALQEMSKEAFIKEVLDGLLPPPQYFAKNAQMNKQGYENLEKVLERGLVALSPEEFEQLAKQKSALILDTRHQQEFAKGFIPKAMFIGLDGAFANWVGTLISNLQQPILFIAEEGREEEVVTRLSRVGYDNALGYLKGGVKAWKEAGKTLDTLSSISAQAFQELIQKSPKPAVLDVRKQSEYEAEHLLDVQNMPLSFLNEYLKDLEKTTPYHIHCAGGYRSMIAASMLKARGFENVVDVAGGFKAIRETALPISDFVCLSKTS